VPKDSADPYRPHLLQEGSPGHHHPLPTLFLFFPGLCTLPSVNEMLEDIEEKKRNKIRW